MELYQLMQLLIIVRTWEVTTTITHRISIRKMKDTDFEVMAKWLSTPEVLEFFGDANSPFTVGQVKRKYEPRINGDVPVYPYIVELDGIPIGFMQHYNLVEKIQEAYGYPLTLNIHGIDQFIGVPIYFNKGIGTIMVTKFMDILSKETDADILVLDPELTNTRAIRCYEKCGFVGVKKVNDGNNWLMELKVRGLICEVAKKQK